MAQPRCPWLIEVKPLRELKKHWSRWHPKFREASRYAAERGWRFRILDEARIRDVVFQNAVLLERYSRPTDTVANDAVLEDIRLAGIRTAGDLVSRHFPSGEQRVAALPSIWRLIATGFVDCDLTQPLGMSTELWIPTHDD
ncbi:MAG: TnsA endonuclease N-terminal domain-containing protein [Vulcanimicrobiaceae bacterium]